MKQQALRFLPALLALSFASLLTAQVSYAQPDLVVSSLEVTGYDGNRITYSYTVTNQGDAPAPLDGPTDVNHDNVKVQAFVSNDPVFNNAGDLPAGGRILGLSPLGELQPGESYSGSFGATIEFDPQNYPYLTLKVDWNKKVDESDESNNTAAVLISEAPGTLPEVPGGVMGWGNNGAAQLGSGTTTDSSTPVPSINLSDIVVLASAHAHSFAVKSDGALWAWGQNAYGQLGLGMTSFRVPPTQVTSLADVVTVSTRHDHSLAVTADGTVWAWGDNGQGRLGDGTSTDRLTPVEVVGFSDAVAVAAASLHSIALKSDGSVWGWGAATEGVLGNGCGPTVTDCAYNVFTPNQVTDPDDPTGMLTGVQAIAASGNHSLALKDDGTLWAWGSDSFGKLGNGDAMTGFRSVPTQVSGLTDVIAIATAGNHSLALKSDKTVWAWGANDFGQVGDGGPIVAPYNPGISAPIQVVDPDDPAGVLTDVVAIGAGLVHSLAVKSDGSVWAWGSNDAGQLGDGCEIDIDCETRSIPMPVSGISTATKVMGGAWFSLAIVGTLPPDGMVGPSGGSVVDSENADASFSVDANVLPSETNVTINVLDLTVDAPAGFGTVGTLYVDITLDPSGPLPPPGATITLPLPSPMTPGTELTLFKYDPETGLFTDTGIVGTVDAGGDTATFTGVTDFSVFVGVGPEAAPCPDDDDDDQVEYIGLVIALVLGLAVGVLAGRRRKPVSTHN